MDPRRPGARALARWAPLAILAVAAALRFGLAIGTLPARLVGDEYYYAMVATHLARGEGHLFNPALRAYRPPGQAFALSLAIDPEGALARLDDRAFLSRLDALDPARPDAEVSAFLRPLLLLSAGLGTALVALTWALARALFDARAAAPAAGLAAVDPTLVAYSHYLWSETLFAVLATAGLVLVVHARRRESGALAALAGIVFGAATLTREIALPVACACGLWWVWSAPRERRRRALLHAGALVAVACTAVLPWTLRNYRAFGRLVPVATVGWASAGEGNTLESPDWQRFGGPALQAYKARYFTIEDEMERMDFARRHALARILAEQPAWIFEKSVLGLGRLFAPDSFLLRKIREGAYGEPGRGVAMLAWVATVAVYVPVLALGVLGIAACRDERGRLALCVLGTVCALHVFAVAHTRYRVPWMPLLFAFASRAALDLPATRAALRGRHAIAPALALAFFAVVCVPYAWEGWSGLWEATR